MLFSTYTPLYIYISYSTPGPYSDRKSVPNTVILFTNSTPVIKIQAPYHSTLTLRHLFSEKFQVNNSLKVAVKNNFVFLEWKWEIPVFINTNKNTRDDDEIESMTR